MLLSESLDGGICANALNGSVGSDKVRNNVGELFTQVESKLSLTLSSSASGAIRAERKEELRFGASLLLLFRGVSFDLDLTREYGEDMTLLLLLLLHRSFAVTVSEDLRME